ncbi:MAG: recombinase family protein, partial [Chloroflexi bacterium]|nr:recombinase family protein [Chloroflexota bacterium]
DLADAGTGMLQICETLNDEGIASPAGKLWSKNGVHFILRNEVYTGTLVWGASARTKADPVRVEKAFPAIVSRAKFNRVNALMRSRAPKRTHPRRVASTYLLSGLLKCRTCRRAFSGQDAKSGQFAYYVCQSIMKRGRDACEAPRLNARRFEEMVLERIRANVLTEGISHTLVELVEEEMDGVGREQRKRLQTIEYEIEDVKRKLARVWHVIETTDRDVADAADRIREHRERRERLEDAAADARDIIAQRRTVRDDVEAVAASARDMGAFLMESELSERRAFVTTFVKEIGVRSGGALVRYTIPMPDDSPIPGRNAEELALDGSVLSDR